MKLYFVFVLLQCIRDVLAGGNTDRGNAGNAFFSMFSMLFNAGVACGHTHSTAHRCIKQMTCYYLNEPTATRKIESKGANARTHWPN